MTDRRYAINVAYRKQEFFREVTGTGQKISSVVPGVEFVLGGPYDDDSDQQIEELEALIAHRVNGIILFPADSTSLAPTINRAFASGIPVVTLFSDVLGSRRLALVGGPERDSGRQIAEHVLEKNPQFKTERTKILVSYNKPGETVTDHRLEGIEHVIEKHKDTLELVRPIVKDGGKAEQGAKAIADILEHNDDIKVIFGLNARSAIGAITALKNKDRPKGKKFNPGDVIVTGWDSDDDVLSGIEEGWIHSTSVLYSSLCTQIGFGILEAHNLGYLYPESLQLRELSLPAVPDKILIPEQLVDKKTVEGYRWKKRGLHTLQPFPHSGETLAPGNARRT